MNNMSKKSAKDLIMESDIPKELKENPSFINACSSAIELSNYGDYDYCELKPISYGNKIIGASFVDKKYEPDATNGEYQGCAENVVVKVYLKTIDGKELAVVENHSCSHFGLPKKNMTHISSSYNVKLYDQSREISSFKYFQSDEVMYDCRPDYFPAMGVINSELASDQLLTRIKRGMDVYIDYYKYPKYSYRNISTVEGDIVKGIVCNADYLTSPAYDTTETRYAYREKERPETLENLVIERFPVSAKDLNYYDSIEAIENLLNSHVSNNKAL